MAPHPAFQNDPGHCLSQTQLEQPFPESKRPEA
jgi:hypothetical protein